MVKIDTLRSKEYTTFRLEVYKITTKGSWELLLKYLNGSDKLFWAVSHLKGDYLTQVREEKWAKDRIWMQIMVKEQVSLEDMIIFGQVFYTKVLLFDLGEASLCSPCRATLEGSGWYVIILIF